MTNRTEIVALVKASMEAGEKVRRNAQKLAWMDATRRMGAEVVLYGTQLAGYEADARKAAKAVNEAVAGLSTEDMVSIFEEARA